MKKMCMIYSNLLYDESICPEAIAVATALNGISHYDEDECYINNQYLRYHMFNRQTTRSEEISIDKGFNNLLEHEYIKVIDKEIKTGVVLDLSNIKKNRSSDDNRFYVLIESKIFHKIMNVNDRVNKFNLLKLYLVILDNRLRKNDIDKKYDGTVCSYGEKYLSKKAGITIQSFAKYIECLEKEEVIYKIRSNGFFDRKTNYDEIVNIKYLTNVYSEFKDKELCEEYVKKKRGLNQYKEKIYDADYSRSMRQIYNWMQKGKFDYDKETVELVREYIEDQNIKIRDGEIKGELFDMDVFDEYLLFQ